MSGTRRQDDRFALASHAAAWALCATFVSVIWLAHGRGYYWPRWVWFAGVTGLGLHVVVLMVRRAGTAPDRWLGAHAVLDAVIGTVMLAVWSMTGAGAFWPLFPLVGLAITLAFHAVLARHGWVPPGARARILAERVDVLTRTRRGVLDVQAAEMRRIERDLHDGAQARLVALSMLLGRAEEQFSDRPDVAAVMERARDEASAAIAELRDLARGIAPPVLADRGLVAALEALGQRTGVPVEVHADLAARPLPVVETAAYFVVSEALTNIAKHAGATAARVDVHDDGRRLVVEVADHGRGGADASGGGLTGLRHRVEALDGTLLISSRSGGGTLVRAELPCE
jgi:signal transduction histidine kinase